MISILRSFGVLALGNGLAQLIYVIGFVFLSRIYDPAIFGEFAVALAVGMIIGTVASLRLEMTILLARSVWQARLATQASLVVAAGVIVIVSVTLLVLSRLWEASWSGYWAAIPTIASSYALVNIFSFVQTREERYAHIVLVQIARSVSIVVFAYILSAFDIEANKLIISAIISSAVVALFLLLLERQYRMEFFRNRRFVRSWISRHREVPIFSSPAVLVSSLASQAPVLLIALLFGQGAAGIFSLVQRLVNQPVQILSGAVNRMYLKSVSAKRIARQPILPLSISLLRIVAPIAVIGTAIVLVAAYLGVFGHFLGDEWKNVDWYIFFLTPVLFTGFLARSIAGFAVLGSNRIGLAYQVILLIGVCLALILSRLISDSALAAVMTLSATMAIIYASQTLTTLWITKERDNQLP